VTKKIVPPPRYRNGLRVVGQGDRRRTRAKRTLAHSTSEPDSTANLVMDGQSVGRFAALVMKRAMSAQAIRRGQYPADFTETITRVPSSAIVKKLFIDKNQWITAREVSPAGQGRRHLDALERIHAALFQSYATGSFDLFDKIERVAITVLNTLGKKGRVDIRPLMGDKEKFRSYRLGNPVPDVGKGRGRSDDVKQIIASWEASRWLRTADGGPAFAFNVIMLGFEHPWFFSIVPDAEVLFAAPTLLRKEPANGARDTPSYVSNIHLDPEGYPLLPNEHALRARKKLIEAFQKNWTIDTHEPTSRRAQKLFREGLRILGVCQAEIDKLLHPV
jgi:hypothetical protein